jgi:hypothetical protein
MTTRHDLIALIVGLVPHALDRREDLPRHATRKWGRRVVYAAEEQDATHEPAIQGVVVHQSAWPTGSADGINRYHIAPNHISESGCPRACYFAIIDDDEQGTLHICNDLEDKTWSQGGAVNPIPGTRSNSNFIGICVIGSFDGPTFKGKSRGPSAAQVKTLNRTLDALAKVLGLDPVQTYGHYHFGKENCPGKKLQKLVETRRQGGMKLPRTDREWQQMLVDLGYDLGAYGANKDGVDGDWGSSSRLALLAFQRTNRAADTGMRDAMSAVELATCHAKRKFRQSARALIEATPGHGAGSPLVAMNVGSR